MKLENRLCMTRLHQMAGGTLLLAGVIALLAVGPARMNSQSGAETTGRVTQIGVRAGAWGEEPVMRVVLADGSFHQVITTREKVVGCAVGDRISLVRQGSTYRVGFRACQR